MLTQQELKSFAHYDPETGVMTRTRCTNNKTKIGEEIGCVKRCGDSINYRETFCGGKSVLVHRLAFLYMTGELPEFHIDHIDGDGLNNKWSNLRLVDRSGNMRNRKLHKSSTTGVPGVSWITSRNEYRVAINIEVGRKKTLGYFKNFDEAVACRKAAEAANDYHPNHGRKSA